MHETQRETAQPITSVWAPTAEGAARAAKKPTWWKTPVSLRYTKPSGPKPKIDKTSDAYQGRLEALPSFTGGAHAQLIGRQTPEGYYLVATDGHRALLRLGTAPKPGDMLRIGETADMCAVSLPDDFAAMCTRLRTCTAEKQNHQATLKIGNGRITIEPRDFDTVLDASEWCAVEDGIAGGFGINLQYLIDGLGRPCRLWFNVTDPTTPIIIEAQDKTTRYVLMPLRVSERGPNMNQTQRAETAVTLPRWPWWLSIDDDAPTETRIRAFTAYVRKISNRKHLTRRGTARKVGRP